MKVFLNLSKRGQAKRFLKRIDEPQKNWKFSESDIREREHWNEYQKAFSAMLSHTSTQRAPWHVVPANRKWYRDYVIAKTVVKALEGMRLRWPKPHEDLAKFRVV